MAYFECIIGSGNATTIPLIVTCSADFAGQTITCTDGTTTLTQICPSVAPFEVDFELPYGSNEWTISGTVGGYTYSESIYVNLEVELKTVVDINVDVYSAINDTISYTGIDNQVHTISTDGSGHAYATISVYNGRNTNLTFQSSIALDVENDDLSTFYSKTITLNKNTTDVKVMPDNAYAWFGNQCDWNSGGWQAAEFTPSSNNGTMSIEDYALKLSDVEWACFGIKKARDYTTNTKMKLYYKGLKAAFVLTSIAPNVTRTWDSQYTVMTANNHYPDTSSYRIFTETLTSNLTGNNQYYQIKAHLKTVGGTSGAPFYVKALLIDN